MTHEIRLTLAEGDRIRLLVLDVRFHESGSGTRVHRRFDWTDTDPDHMCVPASCDACTAGAIRTASRRLGTTGTATVRVLRDGQSTYRKPLAS